jgi:hypothetical protein
MVSTVPLVVCILLVILIINSMGIDFARLKMTLTITRIRLINGLGSFYNSPYENPSSATGLEFGSFFDQVDAILIPPKDGKSTADQIRAANGNLSAFNSAYNDHDSMTAALEQLGNNYIKYQMLPITWTE